MLGVGDWLAQCGVRWGLDAADHARHCSVAFDEFSWFNSLDNMFEIFARGSDELENIVGHAPLIPETNLELFGKLNHFIRTLAAFCEQLGKKRTLPGWMNLLLDAVNRFLLPYDRESSAEVAELRRFCSDRRNIGYELHLKTEFPLDVIVDIFSSFLSGSYDRYSFLRGKITFCSLIPLRSIPAQVIAIMGLDEGSFPRQ